jgi:hypothetical protein
MFDFETKYNCCKCISVSLYFNFQIENINSNKHIIEKYLTCLYISANSILSNLPDYLYRLYFDESVEIIMQNIKLKNQNNKNDDIINIYDNLINMPNIEIIYLQCKNNNINLTRTYRFLPFIDDTVCYVNIREADGIVNFNDCLNIRNLERSNDKFILISNFYSIPRKDDYHNFDNFIYESIWNNKIIKILKNITKDIIVSDYC